MRLNRWRVSWELADKEHKPMFIAGDLNIDVTPWLHPDLPQTRYQKKQLPILTELRSMASNAQLELMKTACTRKQGKNKASILDIVLTNKPDQIANIEIMPSSSDHHIVIFSKVMKYKPKEPLIKK